MARYESYKELHTEVTAAANCPNPEELKSKIDIIINKFDSMHLEWNDEVKANFDNFKTSCIEFLKKISDSVGTNLVSAKDTYDDLKEILDKFQKDDATYNEKIENEPSPRYKVKGVYPNGATIYSSEETEEYSTWESEIDALNTAFNTYTIDIEKKTDKINIRKNCENEDN